MLLADFVRIHRELMKTLSDFDIRMDDFKYVDLYEEYDRMVKEGDKVSYIVACLTEKYGMSETSVYRVLKRFKVTF